MANNNKVYQLVTDKIVAQLEKGIIPWHKPWSFADSGYEGDPKSMAIGYESRRPYSLLNQFLLGFRPGEYLTYSQIKKAGGKIKKGAESQFVVYFQHGYDKVVKGKDEITGEEVEECVRINVPILRYYNVFHITDCEGIESKFKEDEVAKPVKSNVTPIEEAEKLLETYTTREKHLTFLAEFGNKAFYSPSSDKVVVPRIEQYKDAAEYYSTTFHELVHSTGHEYRLGRLVGSGLAAFGTETYSKEELVAEMGSAFILATLGIDCKTAFNNSVAYIQGWAKHLKERPKEVVFAAAQAEKAVNFIMTGIKPAKA